MSAAKASITDSPTGVLMLKLPIHRWAFWLRLF
jgi:hypothetical protein